MFGCFGEVNSSAFYRAWRGDVSRRSTVPLRSREASLERNQRRDDADWSRGALPGDLGDPHRTPAREDRDFSIFCSRETISLGSGSDPGDQREIRQFPPSLESSPAILLHLAALILHRCHPVLLAFCGFSVSQQDILVHRVPLRWLSFSSGPPEWLFFCLRNWLFRLRN